MNDKEVSVSDRDLIVKANALIDAAYTLSLAEQNVILAAVAQVRRDEPITDAVVYSITANALADLGGFKAGHEYQALREVAERLWERTLIVHEKPNGNGKTRGQERWLRWVQECVYIEDEGRVELRFGKGILPYLTELQNRFTQYERRMIVKMRSRYGIRLFELIMQWRQAGEREVEIEWLRQAWGLDGKYPSIADLKRRVIDPAVRDVNEHTDLDLKIGYRKRGRVVAYLQLKFQPKKKPANAISSNGQGQALTAAQLTAMARPGENWDDLARRAIEAGHPANLVNRLIRQIR